MQSDDPYRHRDSSESSATVDSSFSHTCQACELRDRNICGHLSDDEMLQINESKQELAIAAGQIVFRQGDAFNGIYTVESGTLALRKFNNSGDSSIVRLIQIGQTVGYRAHFDKGIYTGTLEALSDARVCYLPKHKLEPLLKDKPRIAFAFLTDMAETLRSAEEASLEHHSLPVRARVVSLLLTLRDRYGVVDDNGNINLDIPMTRQDMASIVGTRPETMTRTLKSLEKDGVVKFKGRFAVITDLDLLFDEIEPV